MPAKVQWYDTSTNTIHLSGRGHKFSLTEIAEKDKFNHLTKESDGVWLLKSNIYIESGVSLNISSTEVVWLKMQSDSDGFVTIIAYNTRLTIQDTKITSWDTSVSDVDLNYGDGRSYILVKANSRMDIYNSELSYLGYKEKVITAAGGTYGISWRIPSRTFPNYVVTGEVLNNNFHHNYFGAYTYGATGIVFRGNKFNDNVAYGLDPHDDSNNFIVENNIAERNGTHGIIFSKRCFNNIIVNNRSINNNLHGIMLHADSNNNIIRNNYVEGNKDGIALYASSGNLIQDNTVKNSINGIRLNERSNNNFIINNEVTESNNHGLYVYANSNGNTFRSNKLVNNLNATYIKTNDNELSYNLILNNGTAFYLLGNASNNVIISNELSDNTVTAKIKTAPEVINFYKLTNLLTSNN
jgi:parallel beta-helix repeat protein